MGLFRRKKTDDGFGADEPGVDPDDLQLLRAIRERGADLAAPRHVVHYLYAGSAEVAAAAGEQLAGAGWPAEVREPLPEYPDQWAVVAERPDGTLTFDAVRDMRAVMLAVAEQHGIEYDGWEAGL